MVELTPKIKRRIPVVFVVLVLAALGLQLLWKFYWPTTTVLFKDQELTVLVADNLYRQHKGLGGRESLEPYDGMIFPFSLPEQYAFVMRDMRFAIDIVWFNNGVVVDIAPNVAPENKPEELLTRYYPRAPATLVLELPAGWAEKHGVKLGDRISTARPD